MTRLTMTSPLALYSSTNSCEKVFISFVTCAKARSCLPLWQLTKENLPNDTALYLKTFKSLSTRLPPCLCIVSNRYFKGSPAGCKHFCNHRCVQGSTCVNKRGISRSHYVLVSCLLPQEVEGVVVELQANQAVLHQWIFLRTPEDISSCFLWRPWTVIFHRKEGGSSPSVILVTRTGILSQIMMIS